LPALSYTVYVNGEEVEVIEPTGYTGEITSVYFEDLSDDDEALEADYAEVTWSADYFTGIASVRIIAGGQNKSWMYGPSKLVTFNTPFNLEPMDPEAEPLEYEFEVDPVFEVTYTNGLVIKYTPEYTYIPFEAPEEPVV
jgi:hypothetical protein